MKNLNIALCISGQMRTYQWAYPHIKKNLIDKLDPDIFIHTWSQTGKSHKENLLDNTASEKHVTYDDLEKFYQPQKAIIEDFYDDYFHNLGGKSVPNELIVNEPKHYKGSLPMFYKMKACNDLKKRHEQENNFIYDLVIKIRPDLSVLKRINSFHIKRSMNKNQILFSDFSINRRIQISDKFFFGPSPLMDIATNVWDDLGQYWQNPLGDGQWETHRVGERLMKYHFDRYRIDNEPISLLCKIERVDTAMSTNNKKYNIKNIFKKLLR